MRRISRLRPCDINTSERMQKQELMGERHMGHVSSLAKQLAHTQVCRHGSSARDSGKYWQTTHSCSPAEFHMEHESSTTTGRSSSSQVSGLPVARYSCCNRITLSLNPNAIIFRNFIFFFNFQSSVKNFVQLSY